MTESHPVSQPEDARIQAALQDYLERVDRGESVDREAFLAEHADVGDELRSFIETSENLEEIASEATSSVARRDAETLVPNKVQGESAATESGQLPAQFGRYRVLRPLGSGAMGTVYLAEDTQLQRQVALKTPSFDKDDSGELLERFYREARAAAVLRHSNICPVFDVDQIDGRHFISMAYIEGRPLSAYIQPNKPQPERQILLIVRKLALALREAHDHGIVHRDLKPGNIMIDPKGEPIIMDFGLARRVTTDEDHRITQSGVLVGSPAYMSPEQVEGEPDKIGPASDQYSLGVILYEMLTGQLPFRGSITGVIGQILTKEPTRPGELRAGLDPRIEAVCNTMMAKRVNHRFPSVKDVADEVARILKTGAQSSSTVPAKPQASAEAHQRASAAAAESITTSNVESHHRAKQVTEECGRYGGGLFFWRKPRTVDGRRVGEGSWIPWMVIPVAVVAFCVTSWLVYDYWKSDGTGTVTEIEVPEPVRAVAPFDAIQAAQHQQEWADYLDLAANHTNGTGMEFRLIPPGEFKMGENDVTIENPFYLGVHEVTQEQYEQVMGTNPSERKASENPVHNVSWDDAASFCQRLSVLSENGAAGNVFRLPTEAEWEYACRAGMTGAYGYGDDASQLGEYAWFSGNADKTMHPVGRKAANAWSLHDMHANVWEWCQDEFDSDRVVRGGCWFSGADLCRSGSRRALPISDRSVLVGFRVLLEVDPTGLAADGRTGPRDGIPLPAIAPFDPVQAKFHQDAWADQLRMPPARDIGLSNGGRMTFSLIPPGEFATSEDNNTEIEQPFYLGVHEVTQDEYESVMGSNPSRRKGSENPVHDMSWDDAVDFCQRLSELPANAAAGFVFRLPTEAEWEYACRAGTTSVYSFGDDASQLGEYAWFLDNSDSTVHPVSQLAGNPWSLYDMHGNVYEWCQDSYGANRAIRGGCWFVKAGLCRSSSRRTVPASDVSNLTGFRVLLEIESTGLVVDDVPALQGTWTAVSQEIAGVVWTPDQITEHEKTITFTDDAFEIRYRDRTGQFQIESGTCQLDPTQNPRHITMTGTRRDGRAIEFSGIYRLDGDQLQHCFVKKHDNAASPRPISFSTSAGDGRFSTVYRRDVSPAAATDARLNAVPFPENASFTDARALSELNEPGITNAYPWIAPDGLTIYWTREGDGSSSIRQARRRSIDEVFGGATTVLEDARLASVAPDGLEMACLFDADGDGKIDELCSSRRSVTGVVFARPRPIQSLRFSLPKGTAFSADGLSLFILESGEPTNIWLSQRSDPGTDWGPPERVDIRGQLTSKDWVTWPSLDAAGEHLLLSYTEPGTRDMEWGAVADRTVDPATFDNSRPLLLDGERFVTRGGRYCAASGELFFTRPIGPTPYQEVQLWVARVEEIRSN